jgi:hypothetical protein
MELFYKYYPMDLLVLHFFFLAGAASDRMRLVYLEELEAVALIRSISGSAREKAA